MLLVLETCLYSGQPHSRAIRHFSSIMRHRILSNRVLADFSSQHAPRLIKDMEDELQKTKYVKLQEEMKLQKQVAEDAQQKSNGALLEAKKTASQFQKDFEKCNSGMETNEGAWEKAEKLLVETKKSLELWEARAKKLGWKEDEETKTTKPEDADEERRATEEEHSKKEEEEKTHAYV